MYIFKNEILNNYCNIKFKYCFNHLIYIIVSKVVPIMYGTTFLKTIIILAVVNGIHNEYHACISKFI